MLAGGSFWRRFLSGSVSSSRTSSSYSSTEISKGFHAQPPLIPAKPAIPLVGYAQDAQFDIDVSHRFSTVRMADRILVLDGGRIVEDGSHAELVAAGGQYAELFTLQAAGYR